MFLRLSPSLVIDYLMLISVSQQRGSFQVKLLCTLPLAWRNKVLRVILVEVGVIFICFGNADTENFFCIGELGAKIKCFGVLVAMGEGR